MALASMEEMSVNTKSLVIATVELHTGGDPVRIVSSRYM